MGKKYVKAMYYHTAYLAFMQSTSCEMLDWMNHKLESRLWENVNNCKNADNFTLMAESEEELKSLLMRMKEESEKAGLKLNIQNLRP